MKTHLSARSDALVQRLLHEGMPGLVPDRAAGQVLYDLGRDGLIQQVEELFRAGRPGQLGQEIEFKFPPDHRSCGQRLNTVFSQPHETVPNHISDALRNADVL